MSLERRLAHAPKGRGHSCSIGILLAEWPVEGATAERDALVAAMLNSNWNSTALVAALADEGYTISIDHMQQHRRGACTTANCPMPEAGRRL